MFDMVVELEIGGRLEEFEIDYVKSMSEQPIELMAARHFITNEPCSWILYCFEGEIIRQIEAWQDD
jgi:hypothetical protein